MSRSASSRAASSASKSGDEPPTPRLSPGISGVFLKELAPGEVRQPPRVCGDLTPDADAPVQYPLSWPPHIAAAMKKRGDQVRGWAARRVRAP